MTKQEKLKKLLKYAEELNRRLNSPIPPKYKNHPEGFIGMLERDLKKTNIDIEKLRLL